MNTLQTPIARIYTNALTSHASELDRRFKNILTFATISPERRETILSNQNFLAKIIPQISNASIPAYDQPLVYAHFLVMESDILHP